MFCTKCGTKVSRFNTVCSSCISDLNGYVGPGLLSPENLFTLICIAILMFLIKIFLK